MPAPNIISCQQLLECVDEVALTTARTGPLGVMFRQVYFAGKPFAIRLADASGAITVQCKPSAFGGTGSEARQNITFRVPQSVVAAFCELEDCLHQLLEDEYPDVLARWSSCIKPGSGQHQATLRAKITISGSEQTRFFDASQTLTDAPKEWRRLPVNAVLAARGVYIQKKLIGLTFDVTDMEYGEIAQHVSPFLGLSTAPSESVGNHEDDSPKHLAWSAT